MGWLVGACVAVLGVVVLPIVPGHEVAPRDPRDWIVKTDCTAAVLDTPTGDWLVTAAHCGSPNQVTVAGQNWYVVQSVDNPDGADLTAFRVDGNIEGAVGGGFTLGSTPAAGSRVNVWGFAGDSDDLTGCDGVSVSDQQGVPTTGPCTLPDGTSGSPWFTDDGVIHGITGGVDEGGLTDDVSNAVPFDTVTTGWLADITGARASA